MGLDSQEPPRNCTPEFGMALLNIVAVESRLLGSSAICTVHRSCAETTQNGRWHGTVYLRMVNRVI